MSFSMYNFLFFGLRIYSDTIIYYVLKVWNKHDYAILQTLSDHNFSDDKWVWIFNFSVCRSSYLKPLLFEWPKSGNIMKLFCLVNWFTISRLFIFQRRYRKTKVLKKSIRTKLNVKKRRYNIFVFQKAEKNRILNIHSICNYSDQLFSVRYGYILIFLCDLTFPNIFS